MSRRRLLLPATLVAALALTACGEQGNDVARNAQETAQVRQGSVVFEQRCSGCHTLSAVGAEGSIARNVANHERTDGPNFDVRKEDHDAVLYAIRNGGFSGAIMPENIVVGAEAEAVAAFLSKYSGGGGRPTRKQAVPASQGQAQP